jgi:glycine dehydrogenase
MIALGSCTMKLNAAANVTFEYALLELHSPICSIRSVRLATMLKKLEHQLNVITGFAGTTLQPNSGAQGEYAGLMTIRAYHLSRR